MSVGFEPVQALGVVALGELYTTEYADRFPRVEQQSPLEAPIERFGRMSGGPTISLQALQVPPLPRLWFIDDRGTQLVQVQGNWFARNWRRTEADPDYPRYPSLRVPFREDLEKFVGYIQRNKLGDWLPNQCEVTYVNHIEPGSVWTKHGELDRVLALASRPHHDDFLPLPEAMTVSAQYVMTDADGTPVGRLYISSQPGFRRDDREPLVLLTITARGRPPTQSVDGVVSFLDVARECVVRGFAAATSPAMHEEWRRTDVGID